MDFQPKSEPGSIPVCASSDLGVGDDTDLMNMSLSNLISKLGNAVLRETQLKGQVEEKVREIGSLHERMELEKLGRMKVEDEMKKWKEKYEKKKKEEEWYEKLMEVVKKTGVEDRDKIAELRKKNQELEDEKRKAELLVESWKRRFLELEERILRLENDTKLLMNSEVESGADPDVSFKAKKEKEKSGIDDHGPKSGNNNSNRDELGASASERLGLGTFIEIIDSDDDNHVCTSQGTLPGKKPTAQIVSDKEHPSSPVAAEQRSLPSVVAEQKNLPRVVAEDVKGTLKRKIGLRSMVDGSDTEDTSSTSSESESEMELLGRNCYGHTIVRRRKKAVSIP